MASHRVQFHRFQRAAHFEELARGGARPGQRQRKIAKVLQADAAAAGQRMVGRHDGVHRRAARIPHADPIDPFGDERHAQIGPAFRHPAAYLGRGSHEEVEADVRPFLVKARHHRRHEDARDAFDRRHPDLVARHAAGGGNLLQDRLSLKHGAPGVRQQQLARRAQDHAPGGALEKRRPRFLFQLGDLPADCRHRHMQALGRAAQAARLGNLQEVLQGDSVHVQASLPAQTFAFSAKLPINILIVEKAAKLLEFAGTASHRCANEARLAPTPIQSPRFIGVPMPTSPSAPRPRPFLLACPDLSAERLGNTDTPGVWHFDSGVPGKRVMLSALIHGNELCGAWALKEALAAGLRPRRGSLTLAFCNLAAFDRFDAANYAPARFPGTPPRRRDPPVGGTGRLAAGLPFDEQFRRAAATDRHGTAQYRPGARAGQPRHHHRRRRPCRQIAAARFRARGGGGGQRGAVPAGRMRR
ncbi:hypothetical protein G6F65_015246 [Rhizopus arrhizus]|nr:hypothetical protein G6F65_015246 [Rhizopus arrhizus]